VFFGGAEIARDAAMAGSLSEVMAAGCVMIPVVDDLAAYAESVPDCLRPVNGFAWDGAEPEERLCRLVMEELGIEESQRRVFISHKREDGIAVAEQLHDHLSHSGFRPFIDRFHIPSGRDVQAEIADHLEDCALILVVETPLAHKSDWVFDEVQYGVSHQLGLHGLTWPGAVDQIPGSGFVPRQRLANSDIASSRGYDILTDDALARVGAAVEAEHARSIVSRRRYLLVSVQEAAQDAGLVSTLLPGWRMVVTGQGGSSVVQVTPRLPTVDDMYQLDGVRDALPGSPPGILVHAARRVPDTRRKVLAWAGGTRDLTLIPENAIGGHWRER
jgi:hypothetical protein